MNERLNGARIVCESLKREGVEVIFGFPGGAVLPLYDVLPQYPLRHILVRHEQGAIHAADGFARASGKVGVCLATSGPGATNLVTGITNAYMDSVPIVAITGQVRSDSIGYDSFQEADILGDVLSCTKETYQIRDIGKLAPAIREAFYIARTGRPGPVLIDIPTDVFKKETLFKYPDGDPVIPGYWPQEKEEQDRIFQMEKQVEKAIKEIRRSNSPVIIAGNGIRISGAYEELKELVKKMQAPVVSTLHGLAAFPQDDPLALSMIGTHGTFLANIAVSNADLIIAIGMRFDDRATTTPKGLKGFAPNARVIHIDIDPAEIGKNVRVDVPIVGDARRVLSFINAKLPDQYHKEWLDRIDRWHIEFPRNQEEGSELLLPQYCIRCIYEMTKGNANIVTGVGQHQMWAALEFRSKKPNSFFSSGGLGTMGFELPASIGVQVALPKEPVWVIGGDGSFQMTEQELAVVRDEGLPLKMVIINNGYLGMVRQWQERFYGKRYVATPLSGPDFVKLADAYDILAQTVTETKSVRPAISQAMNHEGPYLIDFRVAPEENVRQWVVPDISPSNSDLGSIQKEDISLKKKRVLVALVRNKPGVLERVTNLYRRRGFNLGSVTVENCEIEGFSRMTMVVETAGDGTEQQLEQARKQLEKLPTTVEAHDITDKDFAGQEIILIEVIHPSSKILQQQLDTFGAKIIKRAKGLVTVCVTGDAKNIEDFIKSLEGVNLQIGRIAKSGLVALSPPAIEKYKGG